MKHGTNEMWEAGCRRCAYCKAARHNYLKNLRKLGKTNDAFVPASLALDEVNKLKERHGLTDVDIAKAARLHPDTIRRLRVGKYQRASVEVLKKLKSIKGAVPSFSHPIASQRKIQAMQLKGYSHRAICELHPDLKIDVIHRLSANYRARVTRKTHDAIAMAWVKVTQLPEPQGRSANAVRTLAKKKGYYPFGAWENINDPDCEPDSGVFVEGQTPLTDAILRLRSLAARGFQIQDIAKEANVSRSSLYKIAYGDRPGTKLEVVDRIQDACDVFEPLPDPTGPIAEKTKTLARKRGWTALSDRM